MLKAIYESGGAALGVEDAEILEAMRDLARDGIAGEPSSAASVAAFKQAYGKGLVKASDTVVCVITGSAFKQPSAVKEAAGEPTTHIRADVDELEQLVGHLRL